MRCWALQLKVAVRAVARFRDRDMDDEDVSPGDRRRTVAQLKRYC